MNKQAARLKYMISSDPIINSKFSGKGGKFDFFHILMSDRLGYN